MKWARGPRRDSRLRGAVEKPLEEISPREVALAGVGVGEEAAIEGAGEEVSANEVVATEIEPAEPIAESGDSHFGDGLPPAPRPITGTQGRGDTMWDEGVNWDALRFLADAVTGLWRASKCLPGSETDNLPIETRRLQRHLSSAWDALRRGEVVVRDLAGEPFCPGLELTVIAFQPTPGIDRETVAETIRPSVYFRGALLQVGEVIVNTPENILQTASDQGRQDDASESREHGGEESTALDLVDIEKKLSKGSNDGAGGPRAKRWTVWLTQRRVQSRGVSRNAKNDS